MAGLQVRSIPGVGWPGLPRGEVSQLWAMFLELGRTQWLSPADIEQGQLAQVRTLLEHCRQHVPYYQETLSTADVRSMDDFRRLPVLQRRTYQEQFARFQAHALPRASQRTTTLRTSGTSGMPIEVWQTNLINLWWFAFHFRDLDWCGIDPRGRLAVIRGLGFSGKQYEKALQGYTQEHWGDQLNAVLETGPSYVMDIHQEPRKQLAWLLRVQPDYLLSYPPNVDVLGSLLVERGDKLSQLKTILTLGETLTDEMRGRIEAAFGVPVKNTYSCVEAGYLASPCPTGHGLHVHAENVLLEVVNDEGQPCAPGEPGRVLLTALHNFLTPFIRYEILDGATLGKPCPCGRGLPLLTEVLGKRRPQFRLPDGRVKDSGFLVRQLRHAGHYHQHQIVQKATGDILVRLVAGHDWGDQQSRKVVEWVREYFEAPVPVEVHLLDRLEVTPAGKFRDVVIEASQP